MQILQYLYLHSFIGTRKGDTYLEEGLCHKEEGLCYKEEGECKYCALEPDLLWSPAEHMAHFTDHPDVWS